MAWRTEEVYPLPPSNVVQSLRNRDFNGGLRESRRVFVRLNAKVRRVAGLGFISAGFLIVPELRISGLSSVCAVR